MSEEKDRVKTREVDPSWPRDLDARLQRLGKAGLEVSVVLGSTKLPIEEIVNAEQGTLFELDRMSGQPMDILVNGTPFAKGEIVIVGDHLAVRINELLAPEEM